MCATRTVRSILWQAAAACCALAGVAQASTLQLEPVAIRLTPTSRSAVMQLRNDGSTALPVQVRAFRWDQADGEDRLSPTSELRVSPPIQMVPPGGQQFVRVLLAEGLTPHAEQSYRLIIDELPGNSTAREQVRMLIRYSVPVTVRPGGLSPASLTFRIAREGEQAVLEARNAGGQGAQLSAVQLNILAGSAIELNRGLFGYVLAGQTRRWRLELPDDTEINDFVGISARVDGKPDTFALEVMR